MSAEEEADVDEEETESEEEEAESEEEQTVYLYKIPLEAGEDGDTGVHNPSYKGDVLQNRYTPSLHIVAQTEAIPHFHKDSSVVEVEEMDKTEYEERFE